MNFENMECLGNINNIQCVDGVKITEMCIDDRIYYIYNDHQDYVKIINKIRNSLVQIIDKIKQFLQQKLEQGHIQTNNNKPLFISDEHILLFSIHEISLHFTQTNIIGALEVGLMIDLDKFNPVAYTLLDDVAEDEK